MYSVIIVDDEPTIRAGLQTLINWEGYGFNIVGDAVNGREALLRHQELKPDLMIIDIRMPGMNGLEVIEEIRKTDRDCHFLILSGYADFDYAKQAINKGVDGYILKPVDEAEMIELLASIHAALRDEKASRIRDVVDSEELREKWIHSMLFDELDDSVFMLSEETKQFVSAGGPFQIILLEYKREVNSRYLSAAKKRIAGLFEINNRGMIFTVDSYTGILLKDVITDDIERRRLVEEINRTTAHLDDDFEIAVGKTVRKLSDIRFSFREASLLLKYKFLFGGEQVLLNENEKAWDLVQNISLEQVSPDLAIITERLYYALDMGNKAEIELWIERAGLAMISFNGSETYLKTGFGQLVSIVLNRLGAMNHESYAIVQEYMPMLREIYAQPNFKALKRFIFQKLFALSSQINSVSNQPILKQMADFIERHYSDNLKLETLADIFNYNSGYLGKIFKQYTGHHFHTYLDKIRIQKAIVLLGQGLKVHQVAERVGYANADYFHNKFKKYIGDSPSSYKGRGSQGVLG